ncbi:MAG: hypothetical protein RL154_1705, partial [Pseudomonadota bacterium]
MKWLVALGVSVVVILAFISFPVNKELEYVFNESGNYKELTKLYSEELNKSYSNDVQKKLILTLIKQKDKSVFSEAAKYFAITKDKELAKELINYSLFVQNKKEYLKWLNTAYEISKDSAYIKQRADYFSYQNDTEALKTELMRLYKIDGKIDTLKALYAVGVRKFAIDELYAKKDNLTDEQKVELFYYLSWDNKLKEAYDFYNSELTSVKDEKLDTTALSLAFYFNDFDNLVNIYAKLYNDNKKIEYLVSLARTYETLFMMDKAIATYEKLYFLTNKQDYLYQAYNIAHNLNKSDKADELKEKEIFTYKDENELIAYVVYLIDKNEGDRAVKILNSYIAQNLKSLEARNALAFYYVISDKPEDAKELFYSFVPDNLSDRELYYFTISNSIKEEDLAYIAEFAKRSKNPEYLKKAVIYVANKRGITEARQFFEDAIGKKIDENSVQIYLEILPPNYQSAEIKYFIQTSLNIKTLNKIGKYLMAKNSLKEAKEAFLAALELNPKDLTALKNMGKLELWSSNIKAAKPYFDSYLEIAPNDSEVRFYLAEIDSSNGLTAKAFTNYKFVLEHLEPKSFEQDAMFIKSYSKVYGIARAKEAYKALAAKANGDQTIYTDYIEALYNEKKWDELTNEFKGFDYKTSKNARLTRLYANFNSEMGRYGEAKSALDAVAGSYASLSSSESSLFGDTAYAYEKAGSSLEALRSYNKALRLDPTNDAYIKAKQRLQAALGSFAALEFDSQNGNVYKGGRVELADDIGRVGFSYLNNTNGDMYRLYLADIEKKKYLLELGNRHVKAFYGDWLRASFESTPFQPNNTAAS